MSDNKKAADAAASASLQEEMDAVMRKYDRESATRIWAGKPKIVISVVMALFSVYCIWSTLFSTAALEIRLTAFLGLIVIMGYLTYPASKKHVHANRLPWYDIVIMVIGAAAFFYYCFNYSVLIKTLTSAAKMTPFLIAVGVAGILVLTELCRRCVGLPILVVVGALLVPLGFVFAFGAYLVTFAITPRTKREDRTFYLLNGCGFNLGCFALPFVQAIFSPTMAVATCLYDAGNAFMMAGGSYALTGLIAGGSRIEHPVRFVAKRLFSSLPFDTYLLIIVLSVRGFACPPSW